jgi:hypothetical protein
MDEMKEPRQVRRRRSRPSLFGPLILIAIGIVFLLNNMGILTGDIWGNILNLWPVLLIAIGLDSIYRGNGVVGAAFMIGIGTVFLLANLGYLAIDVWRVIFRLWPLLLVAIGFDILIGRRSWLASIIGLIVILALLGGALWYFGVRVDRGLALTGEQVSQSLSGATQARITIQPGAGAVHLNALSGNQELISGRVSTAAGQQIKQDFTMDGDVAVYNLHTTGANFSYPGTGPSWDWNLGLTPSIPIDLQVDLGAGSSDIDLSGLNISSLRVNTGVGRTTLILPSDGSFQAKIDSAIGQTVVIVPAGMAVQVRSSTGLANTLVPGDFEKQGDVYTSPGYASASSRIDLDLSQAIGNITIQEGQR